MVPVHVILKYFTVWIWDYIETCTQIHKHSRSQNIILYCEVMCGYDLFLAVSAEHG